MAESAFNQFFFGTPPAKPRRPRAPKAVGAFLTIGELAEQLQLEQHVLRYWESKFPQIQPLKRAGGRRYYRPEDVETIRQIQAMLYRDGYTIRGAQKALSGGQGQASDRTDDVDAAPATAEVKPINTAEISVSKLSVQKLLAQLQEMRRLLQS